MIVAGSVSKATNAVVIVVADESVDLLMVEEPTTTIPLAAPVSVLTTPDPVLAGTRVDVATLEVIVEPSAFVVVTATVVGSSIELVTCEEAAAADEASADELAATASEDAGASDDETTDELSTIAAGVLVVPGVDDMGVSVVTGVLLGVVIGSSVVEVGVLVGDVVVGVSVVDGGVLVAEVSDGVVVVSVGETVDVGVVVLVEPVPATCLLGMMPRGTSSA